MGHIESMQVVAETKHYASVAEKLLTQAERDTVIRVIASSPEKGAVMEGTGGI